MKASKHFFYSPMVAIALGLQGGTAVANTYPSRAILMVVPNAAGSTSDSMARVIGQSLSERFGQPVVIENRAGAGGVLAVNSVSMAKPDGYTIMMGTNTTMAANVYLYKSLRVDPLKAFTPLALIAENPFALLVAGNSVHGSVSDLIKAAQSSPGTITYGAGTSSALICMEMFKSLTGVDITKISYNGSTQALTDLIANRIDVICDPLATSLKNRSVGHFRPLAQTGSKRSALALEIPTLEESGVRNMHYVAWTGFWAPADLPEEVSIKLSQALVSTMEDPKVIKKMRALGSEPLALGAESLARVQRLELKSIGKVVRAANIAVD